MGAVTPHLQRVVFMHAIRFRMFAPHVATFLCHCVHMNIRMCKCAGTSLVIDGIYANFSSALPLDWVSSKAEINVVHVVPFMADSVLENSNELNGNIALMSRDTEKLKRSRGMVPYWEKVRRASEAGATGVIIVNTADELEDMGDNGSGYKSEIPVLMIKSSDAARLVWIIRDWMTSGFDLVIRDWKRDIHPAAPASSGGGGFGATVGAPSPLFGAAPAPSVFGSFIQPATTASPNTCGGGGFGTPVEAPSFHAPREELTTATPSGGVTSVSTDGPDAMPWEWSTNPPTPPPPPPSGHRGTGILSFEVTDLTKRRPNIGVRFASSTARRVRFGIPVVIDGIYADSSSATPQEWVVGDIGLGCLGSTSSIDVVKAVPFMADSALENATELRGNIALVSRDTDEIKRLRSMVPFWEKAKRASEAGAAGIIIVNTADDLNEPYGIDLMDKGADIPVILITSSDAVRLREQGGVIIQEKGTPHL